MVHNFGLITWRSKSPAYGANGTTHVAPKRSSRVIVSEPFSSVAEQDACDQCGLRWIFCASHSNKAALAVSIIITEKVPGSTGRWWSGGGGYHGSAVNALPTRDDDGKCAVGNRSRAAQVWIEPAARIYLTRSNEWDDFVLITWMRQNWLCKWGKVTKLISFVRSFRMKLQ